MHISQIALQNWKAYASAAFDFPAPEPGQNIVLIGAENGHGKTSLFQAIVLCLFGQHGLDVIGESSSPRERPSAQKQDSKIYKEFLERALHNGAIAANQRSCSVKLTLVVDGVPLEIKRVWHFTDRGRYCPQDEEIQIYMGAGRRAVGPVGLSGEDRLEWCRDFIQKNLIPVELAHFFLFDGEQVSSMAEREQSTQVRDGIQGLLGIPVLNNLAANLRDYAKNRRSEVRDATDDRVQELEKEIEQIEKEQARQAASLSEAKDKAGDLKQEREKLTRDLTAAGGTAVSQASVQSKIGLMKDLERQIGKDESQLDRLMQKEMALALTGQKLRRDVIARLKSEIIRGEWESAKNHATRHLDRFMSGMKSGVSGIEPALNQRQSEDVLHVARSEYSKLWEPPLPKNCADEFLHPYLGSESDRSMVIRRLDEVDKTGATSITDLAERIAKSEAQRKKLRNEIATTKDIAPDLESKRKGLSEINDRISSLDKGQRDIERDLEGIKSNLTQRRADLARLTGRRNQARRSQRLAFRAELSAATIDEIVRQAVPSQVDAISKNMTAAYRKMSSKAVVKQIKVDEHCNVKMLNSKGKDLRDHDISAGEKQLFTQSLFSAVIAVSGRLFPLVVDTPVARLDEKHRKGMLKHLAQREGQVILLSTDTEVVGDYLETIRVNVQAKFRVRFESEDGVDRSTVHQGYFGEDGEES